MTVIFLPFCNQLWHFLKWNERMKTEKSKLFFPRWKKKKQGWRRHHTLKNIRLWVAGTVEKPMGSLRFQSKNTFWSSEGDILGSAVVQCLVFVFLFFCLSCLFVLFIVVALAWNATGVSGATSCAQLITFWLAPSCCSRCRIRYGGNSNRERGAGVSLLRVS